MNETDKNSLKSLYVKMATLNAMMITTGNKLDYFMQDELNLILRLCGQDNENERRFVVKFEN